MTADERTMGGRTAGRRVVPLADKLSIPFGIAKKE